MTHSASARLSVCSASVFFVIRYLRWLSTSASSDSRPCLSRRIFLYKNQGSHQHQVLNTKAPALSPQHQVTAPRLNQGPRPSKKTTKNRIIRYSSANTHILISDLLLRPQALGGRLRPLAPELLDVVLERLDVLLAVLLRLAQVREVVLQFDCLFVLCVVGEIVRFAFS